MTRKPKCKQGRSLKGNYEESCEEKSGGWLTQLGPDRRLPTDLANGLISTLLKNIGRDPPGGSSRTTTPCVFVDPSSAAFLLNHGLAHIAVTTNRKNSVRTRVFQQSHLFVEQLVPTAMLYFPGV